MKIKIMSDSTCDLPAQIIDQYDITILPLTVLKGEESFLDGVTITPADIFAHVAAGGDLCTTSACNIADYDAQFARYSPECDGIIHISLGANFSSSYQNACVAAENYPNVRVIDSMSLSSGQALVVLKACRMAQAGEDLDTIARELLAYVPKIEGSFVIDRLDYLAKGGRCSSVAMLGANLLHLKPCIELKEGKMTVGKKYRGPYPSCLANYVRERLEGRTDIDTDTLFYVKTVISPEADQAARQGIEQYGKFDTVVEAVAGCTISCHCGPGTMGIMFARK